jgi:tetratricopeptide (TPR) repeat protein
MLRDARLVIAAISILAMIAAAALMPTMFVAGAQAQTQGAQNPPPPTTSAPAKAAPPLGDGESSSKTAQDMIGTTPPPPPPDPKAKEPEKEPAPLPAFNPLVATKDVEVGTYYMKRGDVDAAIDRFLEATVSYPTYALPWEMLGEAYEKKGEVGDAIKSYQRYLTIYPHAPTRKKLEEHITQLQSKLQKDSQKTAAK